MAIINVNASRRYAVKIEEGLLTRVGEECAAVLGGKNVLLLTDTTVAALYLETVKASLEAAGFTVTPYTVTPGETSKSTETYLQVVSFLASHRFTRSDAIVALGGGVVGAYDEDGTVRLKPQRGRQICPMHRGKSGNKRRKPSALQKMGEGGSFLIGEYLFYKQFHRLDFTVSDLCVSYIFAF